MTIRALLLALTIVLGVGVNGSSAVTIGDLIQPGATIQQADKLFSNFVLSAGLHSPQGNFTPASPSDVVVTGITIDGNPGLRFTGPFSVNGTVVQSVFSFNLTYDVTVTDPSMVLHDFRHIFTTTHAGQESSSFLQTSLSVPVPFQNLGAIVSGIGIGDPSPITVDETKILATDVSLARVFNVFDLFTGSNFPGQTKTVSVDHFDVTFSQVAVPEASSYLLFASGLMLLMFLRSCRYKNKTN